MLQNRFMTLKKFFCSLWVAASLVLGCTSIGLMGNGRAIITDTARLVQGSRSAYINSVREVQTQIKMGLTCGTWIFTGVAKAFGYSATDAKNARITYRFFDSGKAISIASTIGSQPEDLEYISSVFAEFYADAPYTFDKLVNIMHRHMMNALGYSPSTSIAHFLKIMEAKNKHGYYQYIHDEQFNTYAHLIALNLFVRYWYDTYIKNTR